MVPPYFILLILYNEVTRFFFMRCLQFLNISIFTKHTLSKNIYKIYSFPRRYTYYNTLLKKCFYFFIKVSILLTKHLLALSLEKPIDVKLLLSNSLARKPNQSSFEILPSINIFERSIP